jgi:hypothetical protein
LTGQASRQFRFADRTTQQTELGSRHAWDAARPGMQPGQFRRKASSEDMSG